MYQIGDKVLDKSGKIFVIEAEIEKDLGSGVNRYFVMKPCFPYDFNPGFCSFIPVDKAETFLREIISREDLLKLIDAFPSLEVYPEVNPRERKVFFTDVIAQGDRYAICRVMKSLMATREDRMKRNKPISDFDRRLLNSLIDLFKNEASLVLEIPPEEVPVFIRDRIGIELI